MQRSSEVSTAQRRRSFYNQFLSTVFDVPALQDQCEKGHHSLCCCLAQQQQQNSSTSDENNEGGNNQQSLLENKEKHRIFVISRLESILARFVSDYRAIFAIEGECHNANAASLAASSVTDAK